MIVDVKKYKLLAQVIENRMTLLFDRQFHFETTSLRFNNS